MALPVDKRGLAVQAQCAVYFSEHPAQIFKVYIKVWDSSHQNQEQWVFVLGESLTQKHPIPHTKNRTTSVVEFMVSHMRLIDPQESGCMAESSREPLCSGWLILGLLALMNDRYSDRSRGRMQWGTFFACFALRPL